MFDHLKSLIQAGSAAPAPAPAPKKPVAAPAPAVTPDEPPAASAAPAASSAPVSAEPTIVPYVPAVSTPQGTKLFDESNKLRGTLMPDGKFIAVDVEADPLAQLSEADRVEINWHDEKRIDLPQRSAGRIQWLLQFEAEQQTKDRIANDIHRALFSRPREEFDPDKTKAAEAIKKWIQ